MLKRLLFKNRMQAGTLLAERLGAYARRSDVLVLALPRGGVPVGYAVARQLEVALEILIVRKLGMPGQPELAIGAIASGGLCVLRPDVIALSGMATKRIQEIAGREAQEVSRREELYRSGRPPLSLQDKTVILVDDGVATGATMFAAVQVVRQAHPARLIAAVPVAPLDTARTLRQEVDELICLRTPEPFFAVGAWYEQFPQVSDEEVTRLLERVDRAGVRFVRSEPAPPGSSPARRQ